MGFQAVRVDSDAKGATRSSSGRPSDLGRKAHFVELPPLDRKRGVAGSPAGFLQSSAFREGPLA